MVAPNLDARLACACNCAYDVVASGPLPTPQDDRYLMGAGFSGTPAGFAFGKGNIDASVVGSMGALGVVVAFRGTLPPTLDVNKLKDVTHSLQIVADWIQDFTADLKRFSWLSGTSPEVMIHHGFGDALESLWTETKAEAKRLLGQSGTTQRITFTGHSKGGAVAALAAMRWHLEENAPSAVVSFAAPRAGNRAFADAYQDAPITHERYEYADDLVPHVPSTIGGFVDQLSRIPFVGPTFQPLIGFDYESLGRLRFIDWDGRIRADSKELQVIRDLALVGQIVKLRISRLALDHRIACTVPDRGYMTTVAPKGVCE